MPATVMNACTEWLEPTRALNASATLGPQFLEGVQELGVYVVWAPLAVSGAVQIESAPEEKYEGRWSPVVRVAWTSGAASDYRAITGVHGAIRFRVVDAPIGGDVSVWVVGN